MAKKRNRSKPGPLPTRKLKSVMNADGWMNLIAGLGRSQDKSKETIYNQYTRLDDTALAELYMGDGIGGQIVDIVADDMTREWIEVENDPDGEIINQLVSLSAEAKFNKALKWQRLYGGSIIVVGFMDGRTLDQPINLNNMKGIEWLQVVDRTQVYISTSSFNTDSKSKNFGKVEQYDVVFNFAGQSIGSGYKRQKVHRDRVLEFFGEPVPKILGSTSSELRYWGRSALQRPWEKLRDYGGISGSIVNLMYELIIGVFTLEGLAEMLSNGNEGKVLTRMEIINMTKSIINAVMLGENEKFERNTASLAGVSDIIDRFMMNLSAATSIPVTRLFGRSPAGQNATGESDMRNYYDMIRSKQKNELLMPLQSLVDMLSTDEEDHSIIFNPLVQMTPMEKAEVETKEATAYKTRAEGDKTYIETGVLSPEEVTEDRFPDTMKLEEAE